MCTLRSCPGTTRRAVVSYWWKCVHYVPALEQQEGQLLVTGESIYITLLSRNNKKDSCQLLVKVCTLRSCPGTTRKAVVSYWWKCVHYAPVQEQQEGQLSVTGESVYITLLSRNNKKGSCQLLVTVCTLRSCPGTTRRAAVGFWWWKYVHNAPAQEQQEGQLSATGESMYITLLSRSNKKGSCHLLVKVCILRPCSGTTRRAVVSYWWKYVHYAPALEQCEQVKWPAWRN